MQGRRVQNAMQTSQDGLNSFNISRGCVGAARVSAACDLEMNKRRIA